MSNLSTLDKKPDTSIDHSDRTPSVRVIEFVGMIALAITGYIHLKDMSEKFSEVPYLGVGYGLIVVGSIVSIVLLARGDRRGWMLGGAMSLATLIGYTLSRTTGLPTSTDDIGNWSETLAIWAGVAEVVVVVLSGVMLFGRRSSAISTSAN
jgi:hypothetical protein